MVRLAFAIRLPSHAVDALSAMPRPGLSGLSWTDPQRWIVKLRPLGHVSLDLVEPLLESVRAELDGAPSVTAHCVSVERAYRGTCIVARVEGLDELSEAIFDASSDLVPVTHPQPFFGHVMLAVGKVPRDYNPTTLELHWSVRTVELIADRSSPHAVNLETVEKIPLR